MSKRHDLGHSFIANFRSNLAHRRKRTLLVIGLSALFILPAFFKTETVRADPELVVGCPGGFTSIQGAVNAANSGGKIRVCAGTYNEQVTITKRLTITGENGAIVRPVGMVANSTNLFSGIPVAAVILVRDTDRVNIQSLTVDGGANAVAGCSPMLVGIFFRNASGEVDDCAVTNMKLGSGLQTCQSGLGIFAQSGGGGSSKVKVSDTSVHDYQKNGITGNEIGTDIDVNDNVVTGLGSTNGAAQNGIQVGFGADGTVRGNSVINHVWAPCVSPSNCSDFATNILVFSSDDVTVAQNTLGKSQVGISVLGNDAKVQSNTIFDTDVFDGVAVIGNNNMVSNNQITNSSEAAVFVNGNNNKIHSNRINEAPIGVLKATGSIGTQIAGNHFVNTPVPIQDPPPPQGLGPRPVR